MSDPNERPPIPPSGEPVTAIVPLHDGAESVGWAVRSLLAQEYPALDVLLLDDGSRDRSVEVARELARGDPRVRVVELGRNHGLAHTLNVGLRAPGGPLVLLLHQDCALRGNDWVSRAVALLSSPGVAGVAGRAFHDVDRMTPLERVFWVVRAHTDAASGSAGAGSVPLFSENKCDLYRRQTLLDLGGFDEAFRTGGEDQLLALRLERAGLRVAYDPMLRFDLTLGSDRHFGAGLRKELRYGEQMRTVLWRTRGRAARRTTSGGVDPRLLNRAVGVGWVVATLAVAIAAFATRSPLVALAVILPPLVRVGQLLARAARERGPYRLRGREVVAVAGLGVVMDLAYALGLVTPAPRAPVPSDPTQSPSAPTRCEAP